jgi:son of sevenless-like protein
MAVVAQPMHSNQPHSFLPQTHRATTSTASQLQSVAWQQQQDQALPEDQFTTLFCRALYDYDAQDASALSFRRNDIIEVLSQEPSGWWDGLLGDERGWFPSNYVDIISEEELSLLGSEFSNGEGGENMTADRQAPMVDASHAIMRGTNQAENEEWLNTEMSFRAEALNSTGVRVDGSRESNDFWMPQITGDAQVRQNGDSRFITLISLHKIYYVNTRTGQQSRDLPQEADDDISDSDFAGLTSQSSSRSGTSAGLPFGTSVTSSGHDLAGFGILRRTGTPEPWIRKLADDGMSYFYYNKLNARVQWTRPEAHVAPTGSQTNTVSNLPPSLPPKIRQANGSRDSAYSDDSDVQPSDLVRTLDPQLSNGHTPQSRDYPSRSIQDDNSAVDFTSAERIARSLQQALSPPPPELVTELSAAAKSTIQDVVNNIQLNGLARRLDEDQRLNDLLYDVVLAVRNLLYTSAMPIAQIPTNVLPREIRDTATSPVSPSLKSAQRKVTATLSRLVLSARAVQYDSGSLIADTLSRIEVDAEELERAVLSFVLEVQRTQRNEVPGTKPLKRLNGVFSPANLGLGLVGAGAAGRWKGFGWVSLDQTASLPIKVFNSAAISDMKSQVASVDEQFKNFARVLQTSDENSGQLTISLWT